MNNYQKAIDELICQKEQLMQEDQSTEKESFCQMIEMGIKVLQRKMVKEQKKYSRRVIELDSNFWTCCGGIELSHEECCPICGDRYNK